MFGLYALNLNYVQFFKSLIINAFSKTVPEYENLAVILFMQNRRSTTQNSAWESE